MLKQKWRHYEHALEIFAENRPEIHGRNIFRSAHTYLLLLWVQSLSAKLNSYVHNPSVRKSIIMAEKREPESRSKTVLWNFPRHRCANSEFFNTYSVSTNFN